MVEYLERVTNLRYAFAGVATIFKEERNIRIFAVLGAAATVVGMSRSFPEWGMALLLFAWLSMLSLKLVNSAIERTIDIVRPYRDDGVKKIKDIASGSVLLAGSFYAGIWLYLLISSYRR